VPSLDSRATCSATADDVKPIRSSLPESAAVTANIVRGSNGSCIARAAAGIDLRPLARREGKIEKTTRWPVRRLSEIPGGVCVRRPKGHAELIGSLSSLRGVIRHSKEKGPQQILWVA
jgi:hypothetical protein